MNVGAAGGGATGGRLLVEDAVTRMLGEAPPGWKHLRVEFDTGSSTVTATVTADAESTHLAVPPEAVAALHEYHRQASARGSAWRRLWIDCAADGTLSMRTDAPGQAGSRRWPQRVLAGITLGCLTAAAVLFAVGWRWSPPPRASMIAVPPPSPREGQVFEVLKRWYDAEDRGDGAAMRALACVRPGKNVEDEIEGVEQSGIRDGVTYPEAITGFRDEGAHVWAMVAMRVHPLSERQRNAVEENLKHGGFFFDSYTFVQESGAWKVCDADTPPLTW